ncbi:MAG: hypothetical protein ABIL68_03195, partial [bacterium]
ILRVVVQIIVHVVPFYTCHVIPPFLNFHLLFFTLVQKKVMGGFPLKDCGNDKERGVIPEIVNQESRGGG